MRRKSRDEEALERFEATADRFYIKELQEAVDNGATVEDIRSKLTSDEIKGNSYANLFDIAMGMIDRREAKKRNQQT